MIAALRVSLVSTFQLSYSKFATLLKSFKYQRASGFETCRAKQGRGPVIGFACSSGIADLGCIFCIAMGEEKIKPMHSYFTQYGLRMEMGRGVSVAFALPVR